MGLTSPHITRETQPIHYMEPLKDVWDKERRREDGSTDLEEVEISIHHGVAEIALHIGHGLSFYLKSIPNPQSIQYLIECHLNSEWVNHDELKNV